MSARSHRCLYGSLQRYAHSKRHAVLRVLGIFFFAWNVIGVVWIFQVPLCPLEAPLLYRVVLGVSVIRLVVWGVALCTFLFVGVCLLIAAWFNNAAATALLASFGEYHSVPHPLPPDLIKTIPTSTYAAADLPPEDARCSVCLCDYATGDELATVLCGHHFHKACVDEWWKRESTCPVWYA